MLSGKEVLALWLGGRGLRTVSTWAGIKPKLEKMQTMRHVGILVAYVHNIGTAYILVHYQKKSRHIDAVMHDIHLCKVETVNSFKVAFC